MSLYDEHGPVDADPHEHGPEWWAMGAELCKCGHRSDEHAEVVDWTDGGTRFACEAAKYIEAEADMTPCGCRDFTPELDNQ